ncbi:beta-1,3-galactosyltransferase 1-like [Leptopilina boulardi]|uniref:beta-1,3-galactosyltransferase 1-like n=1 Tax=Leptopilina boulardi TaxID=63433 RepID=UPI0021F52B38|nr:beta-1,3-galactosyltransferase 1-like [Leptopilina boulardi]
MFVMYKNSKFRSLFFKIFVITLIVLTFYAYYWKTIDQVVNQNAILHSNRPYSSLDASSHENNRNDSHISATFKNSVLEPLTLNSNVSHNSANFSTAITIVSTSSNSQISSSSNISKIPQTNNNDKTKKIQDLIKTTTSNNNNSSTLNSNLMRAMYKSGHSISVPEQCPNFGKDMNLAIIVMSAPKNNKSRTAIRQTWGFYGQRKDVSILFIIGKTFNNEIEESLHREQTLYSDIIRGHFVDSYSNLTFKTVSILEWINNYCRMVNFILKTDDDMFINVPRLLLFLNKHQKDKNIIFGRLARNWKPVRNKKNKYYVSMAQYKSPVFPDFTTGPAYLFSNDTVPNLYEGALNQTFLPLEDVFLTGIVAQSVGIKRVQAPGFLNTRISYAPCNVQKGISIHKVQYSEQFDLWKKLLDGKSNCKL